MKYEKELRIFKKCEFWKNMWILKNYKNCEFLGKLLIWKKNSVFLDEAVDCNTVIASCPIIDPITFELEIKRNMMGSKIETDPAELKVTGVLKEISASMSRGDYNVLMAILVENFQEKGDFELSKNELIRY